MRKLLLRFYLFVKKLINPDQRDVIQVAKDNGLTVGEHFVCKDGVIIDPGHSWLITIGDNVTLAPRVHILAHDASTKNRLGYTKIANVSIGSDVFIGASTVVLPGAVIGDDVIVGANAVVSGKLPPHTVCVGNPAKPIMTTDEYYAKMRARMENGPVYGLEYRVENITPEMKEQMKRELEESGYGFIY